MYLTVVIWMICFGDIAFGVTVTFEPSKAAMSDSVTITCERSSGSSSSIAWELDSSPLTSCDGTINDACIPSPTGYTFSTDVSANEFNLSLASTSITDCKTYTCTDATTTTDTESKKLYLGYWDKTEVTSTEPGANTDGSISITTGCVLSPDDLTITWTKIENGNSVDKIALSTSPVPSTDRSTCTRTCHTEEDQKVTSGFTHTEFTGTESETFQYMVTVSHSSYPDNADVYTWTSANYTQKKATPTTADVSSISTPTTKPSTTTTATPTITSSTSTSTTSVSTSTTSPPSPTITTSTQSAPSPSSSSSTTSSSAGTTSKPVTTPNSGNETTVIIISSVVGGLFLIGIVITVVLMLLSQQKKNQPVKHARNHRHCDQDLRLKRPYNQGHPNWQDHGQYNDISYEEYPEMGTKMNPLYVPYRSAHRAEQIYNLGHPSRDHQSYTRNYEQRYYGGRGCNNKMQTIM